MIFIVIVSIISEIIKIIISFSVPTGLPVSIPLVAIVKFEGDKIASEHIYWDQASVLVQIGLLNPEGLPVAGVETANKLMDKTLPSNSLMKSWEKSEKLEI